MWVPDRGDLWQVIYQTTPSTEVSWYEQDPAVSLRLIESVASAPSDAVIDVGAGASSLVDRLVDRGFEDITALDVSQHALFEVQRRLGVRTRHVTFVHEDVLNWVPDRQYDIWHDRAVFHFLTEQADRERYVQLAARTVRVGGALVMGTFAEDGPTRCSGLPVARYSAQDLTEVLGGSFALVAHEREEHITPRGGVQPFTWVALRRT